MNSNEIILFVINTVFAPFSSDMLTLAVTSQGGPGYPISSFISENPLSYFLLFKNSIRKGKCSFRMTEVLSYAQRKIIGTIKRTKGCTRSEMGLSLGELPRFSFLLL